MDHTTMRKLLASLSEIPLEEQAALLAAHLDQKVLGLAWTIQRSDMALRLRENRVGICNQRVPGGNAWWGDHCTALKGHEGPHSNGVETWSDRTSRDLLEEEGSLDLVSLLDEIKHGHSDEEAPG